MCALRPVPAPPAQAFNTDYRRVQSVRTFRWSRPDSVYWSPRCGASANRRMLSITEKPVLLPTPSDRPRPETSGVSRKGVTAPSRPQKTLRITKLHFRVKYALLIICHRHAHTF